MKGYIVYNGFWNSKNIPDPAIRLATEAEKYGHHFIPRANTDFAVCITKDVISIPGVESGDVILCWDKDVRLYKALEKIGAHLYNDSKAVAVCDDKSATHLELSLNNIPMPETWVAPMTYIEYGKAIEDFLEKASASLGFPLIFKECFGSLGEQVYYIENKQQLWEKVDAMKHRPFLLQKYIKESHGTDKRLYVVGNRVVAAMQRHSDSDFRANIGIGGTGVKYIPTAKEETLALKSAQILGLCFAGVDILDSTEGPLVCEVNASAHMAEIIKCTGVNVADEIIKYVEEKEKSSC